MSKRLKARWIAWVAVASFATLGVVFGWQASFGIVGSPGVLEQGDFGRRQGELLFLKAAWDRLDTDANRTDRDSPALRSLHAEQNAVMLRMREVARPLLAESLPRELRFLVEDEPRATAETMLLAAPDIATGGAAAPAELKVGLAAASTALDLALLRDPELNLVILIARARPAIESTADNSTGLQPAKAPPSREPANGTEPQQSLPAKKEAPFAGPAVRGFWHRSVQW